LANQPNSSGQAKALAHYKLDALANWLENQKTSDENQKAHYHYTLSQIRSFQKNPAVIPLPEAETLPDGSPIGMECMH
ncbi:MAG: hypothetical protein KDD99_29155, partial [Bacteroidetes bacterium]|nr:hypothetical protein [Bacteroidota bacterium]